MTDILHGVGLVLFIAALAGAIAYIGDRVGHQVGRRRLTLFGIRPRYTSTIIAIGTGVVIALFVTLGAIFSSETVKTAFFRLNAVNNRVNQLQAQAEQLTKLSRNTQVVVGVNDLMNPLDGIILRQNETPAARLTALRQFFDQTVEYVNGYYVPRGLKPFQVPKNIDSTLKSFLNVQIQSLLQQNNVLVLATADQNLFKGDRVHFGLTPFPDHLIYAAGQTIRSIGVEANPNLNLPYALTALQTAVAQDASLGHGMPIWFASQTRLDVSVAEGNAMQAKLRRGNSKYYLVATAEADVYSHTGFIPVKVSLEPSPAK
ncbi:MAG: DUF3084 domain-containing protein [Candidatus Eremiobacteraeota bacterium]|nr:DUF3084 domain-containing protein [Candidatus Eremiobacteraeota bacterium]